MRLTNFIKLKAINGKKKKHPSSGTIHKYLIAAFVPAKYISATQGRNDPAKTKKCSALSVLSWVRTPWTLCAIGQQLFDILGREWKKRAMTLGLAIIPNVLQPASKGIVLEYVSPGIIICKQENIAKHNALSRRNICIVRRRASCLDACSC
mmetsp:Transcript_9318/g.15649  ORF Transcript_9318/g.15649 Transcript_9318/m.15649 type:complete len:151 (-) Transcript_9318:112-564(-)